MTTEQIDIIKSYLEQSTNGLSKENPKFDFKRDWYDLTNNKDINEFLKDTSSIANTFGPDGFIVIGFDEKTKVFKNVKFADSGLRDSNEINGLINKRVDRLFNITTEDIVIEGNSLSVIHIPPSIDKPHVIRSYQVFDKNGTIKNIEEHKIFVRKNTNVQPATKYDLELMYYDRKNIIPEYRIQLYGFDESITFIKGLNNLRFNGHFSIENTGTRTISIVELKFKYQLSTGIEPPYEFLLFSTGDRFKGKNLIIKSGEIFNSNIEFFNNTHGHISFEDLNELNYQKRIYFDMTSFYFYLCNGKTIEVKLDFYK